MGLELHPVVTENLLHLSSARQSLRSYGSSSGQRELTALFIRAFRATRGDSPLDAEAAMSASHRLARTGKNSRARNGTKPCRTNTVVKAVLRVPIPFLSCSIDSSNTTPLAQQGVLLK